jgi:hypothetical protein
MVTPPSSVCSALLLLKALVAYVDGKLPVSILHRNPINKRMITQSRPYYYVEVAA